MTKNQGNNLLSNDHLWAKIRSIPSILYSLKPKILSRKCNRYEYEVMALANRASFPYEHISYLKSIS